MICIAIDNGSNNNVGRSCYSSQQAVSKFAEHHIDMVSGVHRKCQIRAGVSVDVNKTLILVVVVVAVVVGQTVWSISSIALAYDCLCALVCHFVINICASVMKRNLSAYSHIIFYYNPIIHIN